MAWDKEKQRICNKNYYKNHRGLQVKRNYIDCEPKVYKPGSEDKTIYLIDKIRKYEELEYRIAFRELYMAYQGSLYWKEVVKAVRERDNNTCQDCSKTGEKLIVHHTDYNNWGRGDSFEIEDCILVCLKCHGKRHRDGSVKVPFWAGRNRKRSRQTQEEVNQIEKEIEI